jgi:hypothetical protein
MKSYKLYELVLFCIPKYKPLLGMSIEKKRKALFPLATKRGCAQIGTSSHS